MLGEIKIAIVDYGMSNLYSVKNVCDFIGVNSVITSSKDEILAADGLILPGVGAFGYAMKKMNDLDLIDPVLDFVSTGRPLMGICLGLQLLFSESEEFGSTKGLGLIPGKVVRFKPGVRTKVPHVGWSKVYKSSENNLWENSPLKSFRSRGYMYFVHSFYVVPEDQSQTLSLTSYGGVEFCSSVSSSNIFATQFHPEKSGEEGVKVYREWLSTLKDKKGDCYEN